MKRKGGEIDKIVGRLYRGFRGRGDLTTAGLFAGLLVILFISAELSKGFGMGFAAGFFFYALVGEILLWRARTKGDVNGDGSGTES